MSKRDFLDLLRYYLRSYPENIINDIVGDYEEHFQMGIEKGKTEHEISQELGSPKEIANEFLESGDLPNRIYEQKIKDTSDVTKENNNKKKKMSTGLIVLIVILSIFAAPALLGIGLGLLGGLLGIIIALFAIVISFVVAGIAIIIAGIFPFNFCNMNIGIFGYVPHPLTALFLGIFFIGLSILSCYLFVKLMYICGVGIKKLYLSIRWNILKRR